MEQFIRARLSDPRFDSKPVSMNNRPQWARVAGPPTSSFASVSRVTASAAKRSHDKMHFKSSDSDYKKEGKKDDDKSGSESDSDDDEHKDKAASVTKSEASKDGGDSDSEKKGTCWKGYKKVKGKADYSDDSCVKA